MEKEMATDSSTPPWRIPGTEGPGGLPSMGSHRVDLMTEATQQQWCSSSTYFAITLDNIL